MGFAWEMEAPGDGLLIQFVLLLGESSGIIFKGPLLSGPFFRAGSIGR